MNTKAPTKKWLMKAAALEADCDISAGPALPRVRATDSSPATNGVARRKGPRKLSTSRSTRRILAYA